jgi:chromosome segregation ATPase
MEAIELLKKEVQKITLDVNTQKNETERIRKHLDNIKERQQFMQTTLDDIKHALIGNGITDYGLVKSVQEMKNEIDQLTDFKAEAEVYIKQMKFVVGGLVIAVIGIVINMFKNL